MNCNFNTADGHIINADLNFDYEGEDLLAIFKCEIDFSIHWDIDLIVLRYHSDGINIETGRKNNIPINGVIGEQLLRLATPGLKTILYDRLLPAEKLQITEFALDGFKKTAGQLWQENNEYVFIQTYKGLDYAVTFKKTSTSTKTNMEWEITYIERKSI